MRRTLYVSDLDGTLLHSNRRLSAFTRQTLNRLLDEGVLFSYATARSLHTAKHVTEGLTATFPAIVYNGTMIKDHRSGEVLWQHRFGDGEVRDLLAVLKSEGIAPIVYSFVDGRERFSFIQAQQNAASARFLASHRTDERYHPVFDEGDLSKGAVFYFTCIGQREALTRAYECLRDRVRCLFQNDPYTGEPWLECMPHGAGKAHAALQLKTMLGADRLVVFGDGLNDADLFAAADEGYAVDNAVPPLKAIATAVIGHHDEDSVAAFLADDVRKERGTP